MNGPDYFERFFCSKLSVSYVYRVSGRVKERDSAVVPYEESGRLDAASLPTPVN